MTITNELQKELAKRGTAEVSPTGGVNQITQCLSEDPRSIEILVFGQLKKFSWKPLEECCCDCDNWRTPSLGSIRKCQELNKEDAFARGFNTVVCPNQFTEVKHGQD